MSQNITQYIEVRTPEYHYRYGAFFMSTSVPWVDCWFLVARGIRFGLLTKNWLQLFNEQRDMLYRHTDACDTFMQALCKALTPTAAPGWEFTVWTTPHGRAIGWFPRQG